MPDSLIEVEKHYPGGHAHNQKRHGAWARYRVVDAEADFSRAHFSDETVRAARNVSAFLSRADLSDPDVRARAERDLDDVTRLALRDLGMEMRPGSRLRLLDRLEDEGGHHANVLGLHDPPCHRLLNLSEIHDAARDPDVRRVYGENALGSVLLSIAFHESVHARAREKMPNPGFGHDEDLAVEEILATYAEFSFMYRVSGTRGAAIIPALAYPHYLLLAAHLSGLAREVLGIENAAEIVLRNARRVADDWRDDGSGLRRFFFGVFRDFGIRVSAREVAELERAFRDLYNDEFDDVRDILETFFKGDFLDMGRLMARLRGFRMKRKDHIAMTREYRMELARRRGEKMDETEKREEQDIQTADWMRIFTEALVLAGSPFAKSEDHLRIVHALMRFFEADVSDDVYEPLSREEFEHRLLDLERLTGAL
jgi:hypothetical protein